MTKPRLGIIGVGWGARVQIPAFRATGWDVIAICGQTREKVERIASEHGIPHAFTDYRMLIDLPQVDLVSIVTPPAWHKEMTLTALAAGKHVLCEKPTALNATEAREMWQAALASDRIAIIDHELRFLPTRQQFHHLVREGYLGTLYHVTYTYRSGFRRDPARPWNWWSDASQGGGILGAIGSHIIDALRWWFGDITEVVGLLATFIPERIDPTIGKPRPVTADDYAAFLARFGHDGFAEVSVSAMARGPAQRVVAYGSEGILILDEEGKLWGTREGDTGPMRDYTRVDRHPAHPRDLPEGPFPMGTVHLAEALARAVRDGDMRWLAPAATMEDGLHNQEVLDAVRRSHASGQWEAV